MQGWRGPAGVEGVQVYAGSRWSGHTRVLLYAHRSTCNQYHSVEKVSYTLLDALLSAGEADNMVEMNLYSFNANSSALYSEVIFGRAHCQPAVLPSVTMVLTITSNGKTTVSPKPQATSSGNVAFSL